MRREQYPEVLCVYPILGSEKMSININCGAPAPRTDRP
jgi:hypothetical protein